MRKTAGAEAISALESHGLYRVGLRFGRQVYRLRWFIIALWAVIVLVSIPFAAQIGAVLTSSGGGDTSSESARADSLVQNTLHEPNTQLLVVFQSTRTAVSDPSYLQEVNTVLSRARSFANVTSVAPGWQGDRMGAQRISR